MGNQGPSAILSKRLEKVNRASFSKNFIQPGTIFTRICKMDLSGFPNLLDRAFLEYRIRQTRQRLSVSLNSFANFLDFSPPIVNMWLNATRLPSHGNVERIVPKLAELLDLDVYDTLGLPRPDLNLQRLTRVWSRIPLEFRQLLAEQGEKYAIEGEKDATEIDASKPINQPPLID